MGRHCLCFRRREQQTTEGTGIRTLAGRATHCQNNHCSADRARKQPPDGDYSLKLKGIADPAAPENIANYYFRAQHTR